MKIVKEVIVWTFERYFNYWGRGGYICHFQFMFTQSYSVKQLESNKCCQWIKLVSS